MKLRSTRGWPEVIRGVTQAARPRAQRSAERLSRKKIPPRKVGHQRGAGGRLGASLLLSLAPVGNRACAPNEPGRRCESAPGPGKELQTEVRYNEAGRLA